MKVLIASQPRKERADNVPALVKGIGIDYPSDSIQLLIRSLLCTFAFVCFQCLMGQTLNFLFYLLSQKQTVKIFNCSISDNLDERIIYPINLASPFASNPAKGGTRKVIAYRIVATLGSISAISSGKRETDHSDQAETNPTTAPTPAPALDSPPTIGNIT